MDLSHPLEQISERKLLPKFPFPGPADLPLVGGAFLWPFVRLREKRIPGLPEKLAAIARH
ncbi:hypothetical protein OK348_14005 [Flavobacterium sp. MXW15]|uniref:Uncharacterized protein n=1 Tax=Xanthomonas chitinilytica TaxID=2989819 RepID=A0ABT3JXV1_9XANT|nr:hypothetical protein [Xanthomonas sp. H13-6]MCW4455900.1 hypothetical protein [Flavobacterium sp. MXW15]MCW4473275.1 hypothetical protein [Xanthomonas sp. H13-6]